MIQRKIDPNNLIWKSEYDVGSFRVDMEHQSLFKLAKKALQIRTMENDEKEIEELKDIIKSLYKYVDEHFENEEKYMRSIEYPELKKHQEIHHEMLITLHNFVQSLNDLDIDDIEVGLYEFIEKYFIHHIVDEDMQIGLWVNSLSNIRKTGKWKKEYETGNYQMDLEHKKMFEILDEAFSETDDKKREAKIKTVLHHLYDFMKKHFKSEESHMRHISYPNYQEHKDIHNQIVQECNELLLSINETDQKLFEKKLALFIDEHIIQHMLKEDKQIVEFEQSEGSNS
jgi:hemerythrin